MTSLDMAGISLTLIDLGDENLVAALQSEVSTIAW
jgi:dihydroxyacetone kinase